MSNTTPRRLVPGVRVLLRCGLAVSDSDGILYRVNYHVTTIGRLASEPGVVLARELTSAEDLIAAGGAEPAA
jgi:hypothetical protein